VRRNHVEHAHRAKAIDRLPQLALLTSVERSNRRQPRRLVQAVEQVRDRLRRARLDPPVQLRDSFGFRHDVSPLAINVSLTKSFMQ
jgi:hypothetical protein